MTTATSDRSVCARIAHNLAQSVGSRRYRMWFDRTAKLDYEHDHSRLRVCVPNQFVADWIGKHFGGDLMNAAQMELGHAVELNVRVEPTMFRSEAVGPANPAPVIGVANDLKLRRPRVQSPAVLRHKLDDFIVGPTNHLAHISANRLIEDNPSGCNPLFIHGGCGLGKTHLLQGLCSKMIKRRPDARVLYTTAEQFTNEFLDAVRNNRIEPFRQRIRRLDLLAVDDVHFLANKQATQQEFLHSFNAIGLGGARLALASDSHPKLIEQFSQALISRCVSGMVVEIRQPDTQTRVKIIKALAQRREISLLDTVVDVLARHCTGSVREIEGTLTKLHALSHLMDEQQRDPAHNANRGTIGHTLLNRLLESDAMSQPRKPVRFETVLNTVSEHLQVSTTQILGSLRQRHIVLARSVVIYLARHLTPLSYPEIAAAMGRPSHSTIITAAQRMQQQVERNEIVTVPGTLELLPLTDLIDRLKTIISRA